MLMGGPGTESKRLTGGTRGIDFSNKKLLPDENISKQIVIS
jgi:hypothetical protein